MSSAESSHAEKPEPDRFGVWIRGMHKYFGKSLDSQVEKIYRAGLGDIPMLVLEEALQDHIRAEPSSAGKCPPVSYFVSFYQKVRRDQEANEARARDREKRTPVDKQSTQYFRERLRSLVAIHLCPTRAPPTDPALPEVLYVILRHTVAQFQRQHPKGFDGCRGDDVLRITATYIDQAERLFDEETAEQVRLENQ